MKFIIVAVGYKISATDILKKVLIQCCIILWVKKSAIGLG